MNIETLTTQQNEIINSSESKRVVYAGPGSGKTYTLVKCIIEDSKKYEDYEGFIAISFTNEAANQLSRKLLENEVEVTNSFIGTIDKFVINLIKQYAKFDLKEEKQFKVFIDTGERIRKSEVCYKKKKHEWYTKLKNGDIYISQFMYSYAFHLLDYNLPIKYLCLKYRNIYIDEAQDLNKEQSEFFNKLIEKTSLNAMYVGDINQCIYQFRGSSPTYFNNLTSRGYTPYYITESVRCSDEILQLSNSYLSNEQGEETYSELISFNKPINLEELKNEECLFLASTNKECEDIYANLVQKGISNIYYVHEIKIENDLYVTSKNDIQELIKILFNIHLGNFKYGLSRMISNMETILIENYNKDITLLEIEYSRINEVINMIFDINLDIDITDLLKYDEYRYYYDMNPEINKIMTIHASKGLEADCVYVRLGRDFTTNDIEVRNKYFVAFTRAKRKLSLSAKDKSTIEYFEKKLGRENE